MQYRLIWHNTQERREFARKRILSVDFRAGRKMCKATAEDGTTIKLHSIGLRRIVPLDPAIKLYRPSNGTDGMIFEDHWCGTCYRNRNRCNIVSMAMAYDTDDPEYPPEWRYDREGHPCCTQHHHRKDHVVIHKPRKQTDQIDLLDYLDSNLEIELPVLYVKEGKQTQIDLLDFFIDPNKTEGATHGNESINDTQTQTRELNKNPDTRQDDVDDEGAVPPGHQGSSIGNAGDTHPGRISIHPGRKRRLHRYRHRNQKADKKRNNHLRQQGQDRDAVGSFEVERGKK